MMGEYEPTVPNTRRQKEQKAKFNPETGERIFKHKEKRKEREKSKKEI